jgi:hypothetical protein
MEIPICRLGAFLLNSSARYFNDKADRRGSLLHKSLPKTYRLFGICGGIADNVILFIKSDYMVENKTLVAWDCFWISIFLPNNFTINLPISPGPRKAPDSRLIVKNTLLCSHEFSPFLAWGVLERHPQH